MIGHFLSVNSLSAFVGRLVTLHNDTPADKSEVAFNFATQSNLAVHVVAHVFAQVDTRVVVNYANHVSTARRRPNVDEESLACANAFNAVVLALLTSAHNSLESGTLHVNLDKNLGHVAGVANYLAHHVVRARKLRVHLGADGDEPARNGIHQVVAVRLERANNRVDFSPARLARRRGSRQFARPNRNLVTHFEATLQNGAACHTTFQRLRVFARLVHIERTNDDHVRGHCEFARRNRHSAQVVNHHVDVVPKLG